MDGAQYKTIYADPPWHEAGGGKIKRGAVTGFMAPKGKHSEKPAEMRRMIERVSYPPYIELFGRERVPGWDVWWNEVDSDIEVIYRCDGKG